MTEKIKTRLTELAKGEIPQGYKRTKVGIVPKEWEVNPLSDFLTEYKELSNDIQKYPVYSSSRKGLLPQSEYYDQKKAVETNLGYKLVPILYITYRHMSDDDIFHFNVNETGKPLLVSSEYPVFTMTEQGNSTFIISSLNEMPRFRHFCRSRKLGGTRTRLYFKNLCEYRLPAPPLPEQQKIAQILATQDKIISLKERVLAQKEKQKKYLMQQLLTGKKRLEGFSGEWGKVEVRDIFTVTRGTVLSTNEISVLETKENQFPVYSSKTKNKGLLGYYSQYLYENAITWTTDGANAGDVRYRKEKFYCTNVCGVLLSENGYANLCISELINRVSKHYVSYVGNPKLMNNIMETITIPLPPLPEQQAIANILSTADKEITLLQQDLSKEKEKKKSLMQLLLTGIVRVK